MDPKEYAARLQRMRDEMETAKAREKISNSYNKAMETSPMEDAADRLYAELKAKERPKAKPAAAKKPAAPDTSTPEGVREYAKSIGYKGKYASLAPRAPYDPSESDMSPEDWQDQAALEMRGRIPHYMRQGEFKPADRSIGRAVGVLPAAVAAGKSRPAPAATVNSISGTVKPPPAAKATPAEERVNGLTPAQAEAILADAYSVRGKHGQYTPEELPLIEALKAKAAGFDYGKVKQAPSVYVPAFTGGKK